MSYIWNKFNIKTFPAETLVYCDGYFQEQFSTLPETDTFFKKLDLPIHIIYVGKLDRENTININLFAQNQPIFLSINTENNLPAFFNIFIKNTGKNSEIRGHIMCKNSSDLSIKIVAEHDAPNTEISLQTKVIGNKNSYSRLSGAAYINPNCPNVKSNIILSGLATDKTAKMKFLPKQRILSVPDSAEHSASLFHIKPAQENFLRSAGLSGAEVKDVMLESFMNDFNLF
jgi:hypothetical protein